MGGRRGMRGGMWQKLLKKLSKEAPQKRHGHQSSPQAAVRPSGHHCGRGYHFRTISSIWCTPQVQMCHAVLKLTLTKADQLSMETGYTV